jgi:CheY-like chemotaxis protein
LERRSPPRQASSEFERGDESILIVEDDAVVREYVVAQISRLGYDTLAVSNGAEALAIINGPERIDLLFTDVIMPGSMNGRQPAIDRRSDARSSRSFSRRVIPKTPSCTMAGSTPACCCCRSPTSAPISHGSFGPRWHREFRSVRIGLPAGMPSVPGPLQRCRTAHRIQHSREIPNTLVLIISSDHRYTLGGDGCR